MSARLYHGGVPGLAIGDVIRAPAHLTTELAIAKFYAATCVPDGTVYEVKPIGGLYHDGEFDPAVPCFVATSPGAEIVGWAIPRIGLIEWLQEQAR